VPARTSQSRPKDTWLRALGQNVREQRKAAKLTQERLAELADLSPRTVQKIEAGRLNILVTTLRRLRTGIGCSYQDLLG
jgi:transcriptional regulator with XRE-family HTH domain